MKEKVYALENITSDKEKERFWMKDFFASSENLPISFSYADKKIHGIPKEWEPVSRMNRIDANIIETIYEGTDISTGLNVRVEIFEYLDYPVTEWTAWFTNNGKTPTPLIRDILALDGLFKGNNPKIYNCNGDFGTEGYAPQETQLNNGEELKFAPKGGRPCDGAFPYHRIDFGDCGLTIATGWPAQWSASFKGVKNGVHLEVGQEKTNLRLMPGESIRTPRMTLMSWTGDTNRAINLWRRWYLKHILPKPDGKSLEPKHTMWAMEDGNEFTGANEENQTTYIEKAKTLGYDFDVWWIDAGWYPCKKDNEKMWYKTGTWEPDPECFPNSLAPISRKVEQEGGDLLLWFEPERVSRGTWLDINHPEWLLKMKESCDKRDNVEFASDSSLLNLGNPECRIWLTDHYCKLIKENGVKIYRQDFNMSPLQYWQDNEEDDRQGINENFHVQGYLKFWDDLLVRNPGLWIDSCASGGRRNDLETMRRSVPLHISDYDYGNHPIKLSFHHTLYSWIPYFKAFTLSFDSDDETPGYKYTRFDKKIDRFSFHCAMAPMLFSSMDLRRDDYDYELGVEMVKIWRRASYLLLHGDYYPLTPFSKSGEEWVIWQFDKPEKGEGLIQGIRHRDCNKEELTIYPIVSCTECDYIFENSETGETIEINANELLTNGFKLKVPKRSGVIWFYKIK